MTIHVRVMHDGEMTEYAFDRAQVRIGRGPANDLVVASRAVGITHGLLCTTAQQGEIVFKSPASDLAQETLLVRDGRVLAELSGEKFEKVVVEAGDFLILGGHVRVEILGTKSVKKDVEDVFETHLLEQAVGGQPLAEFAQYYLRASEHLVGEHRLIQRLLSELVQLTSLGLHGEPDAITLLMVSAQDEFHDESWSWDASLGRVELGEESLCEVKKGGDPLARHSLEISTWAKDVLREGMSYLSERPSETTRSVYMPLMRGGEYLGYVMVRMVLSDGEDTSSMEAITVRALASLSALIVNSYQLGRRLNSVQEENRYFKEHQRRHYLFKELICESETMKEVHARMQSLIQSPEEPVLIAGEAGSGKELFGRALHHLGARKDGVFISVQCGAMSEEVLGVELFGCVASELSGALAARKGVFELAHGGTVYLEEVERLSLSLQGKLARVLREGEVRRVGDAVGRQVNARLIVSSNASIAELVREGQFRRDLYMMLKEGYLEVPPLRERREDILPLACNFLRVYSKRYEKSADDFDAQVRQMFASYDWPGNVRQLQTLVEAAVLRSHPEARFVTLDDFKF